MLNNFDLMQAGILTVICGPMFAGKTEELIRRINVLRRAKKKVVVFLPKMAERYQKARVVSHNQRSLEAHLISSLEEMETILAQDEYDAVCFDEVQFLPNVFFKKILMMIKEKKLVICAGLEKDTFLQYRGLLAKLLVRADVVLKLSSICGQCSGVATRTQRINEKKEGVNTFNPPILIAGEDHYQGRCNRCFIEFIEDEEKMWRKIN